jgi:hypothetical protein
MSLVSCPHRATRILNTLDAVAEFRVPHEKQFHRVAVAQLQSSVLNFKGVVIAQYFSYLPVLTH